jgi:hypothetical protein
LTGLLAMVQVPRHDTESQGALWLWVVALPTALAAASLAEWRLDVQEQAERESAPWAKPTLVPNTTRRAQIALGVVANLALVARYIALVKHHSNTLA